MEIPPTERLEIEANRQRKFLLDYDNRDVIVEADIIDRRDAKEKFTTHRTERL